MSAKKVLIIDDDRQFDDKLAEKIKVSGMVPVIMVSGKEALDYIENNTVDFIILDFVMPEMDGDEFYHKFRRDMRKNIPTVVLTNFSTIKPSQDLELYVKSDTDLDEFVRKIKERLGVTV
jgi:DNA-binding response OmpR family regulator